MISRRILRRARAAVLYLAAFGVAGYALVAYGFLPLGSLVHPDMRASFLAHKLGIYSHVFASIVALALGPFQFSPRLRARRPRLHRACGRLYLGVGVGIGGLAGLYMARFAFGGVVSTLGFSLLAACWLLTGWRAFAAIRRGAVAEHREWMTRNFALTLAAVTIRLYLPIGSVLGVPFEITYPAVTWLCWLPNLAVAEGWIRSSRPVAIGEANPSPAKPR